MAVKVFVIVLNYRKHQDTFRCFEAILKSDLPAGSVLVCVDNSPTNESVAYLKQKLPKIHFIKSPKNLGFANGNNLGIKYALENDATHVLIINPDVKVAEIFFGPLISVFDQKSRAVLVGPAIKHIQNSQQFYGLEGYIDWRIATARHINLVTLPTGGLRKAEFITFACVLIKREVFEKVGFLDDKYFMYLEDVDYCLCSRRAGYEIFINPKVVVFHQTSSSFKRPTDKLFISFKSQLRFISKWLNFPKNIIPIIYALISYPYLYLLWTYFDIKKK